MSCSLCCQPEERKITYKILGYPEDSVGRSINTKFLALEMNTSAKEAIDLIREKGKDLETVFYIYVLDKERKMVGVASLKDIVISDSSRTLHEIADTNVIMVNPYMDQEEVIEIFEKYDLLALPVVDRENRVIGIITFDDLTDIIEEEKEEDFEVMAAMAPSDESYMDASVWRLIKKRVVWLLIFLLIETISGLVMQHYDLLLRQFIILSYFIPMLLNAGGTAGSQTSTLIIRGMAMGEIHFADTWKIIVKETLSALIISLILSSVVVLRFLLLNTGGPYLFKFILVVSLTLVFVIWLAGMIAAIFPIVWKKMGWDPAVISGPLVTTSIDVLGLIVYFAIATTILGVK
ncbi:magnesium transporter [Candidatus Calescamantes bacterium]|nr:magnesium transporter [Candidatus Calescamantes bacterium]